VLADRKMTEPGPIGVRKGDLVAGKYRVEGVIGVGGMGVVVSARHEQLGQRVAIKVVRDLALRNDEAVQRFLREARAAVKLKSEHAARVLDVGTLDTGTPYMVMEFLDGSDLGQVLEQRGPVSVELAAEWVAQACEALAEAHAAGIVHRDLKPQNLFLARMVGGTSKVKVLDFGVSKSIETLTSGPGALTSTRSILGSPLYMAPEQMRSSRDVDARVDVWALGVVLFELLTQRWPFEADAMPELCLKVVSDPPQRLSALRPDVPETMVRVIERCLEKNPDQRFSNAAELASALETFMPPGSRAVVERARLAIAGMQPQPAPVGSGAPGAQRTMRSGRGATRTDPTPAAWGSKGAAHVAAKRRQGVVWISGGVVAIAAIGGAALVWHGRSNERAFPASSSSVVASAARGTPAAANVAASPVAVFALAPLASELPQAMSASAPAPSASALPKSVPTALFVPALPVGGRPDAAVPMPSTKQTARDDDIPALR
jgi:eukaryotic-like serine/threonine-protein kinase